MEKQTTKQKDYKKIFLKYPLHAFTIVQEEKDDSILLVYDNKECILVLCVSDLLSLAEEREQGRSQK